MPFTPTTSVLLIDASKNQRTYWADQLKQCSADYEIVEAPDGQSGMDLYQSRQIDCVVLELGLPDISGFQILDELVPVASKPHVAVIVLTQLLDRGLMELAKKNGAYVCFVKRHTTGEDLDKAIQQAVAFVAQMPRVPTVPCSTVREATMITREEAAALHITWKAQAGTRTCLHHYLFLERIDAACSTGNFLCMDCGANVVKRFHSDCGRTN